MTKKIGDAKTILSSYNKGCRRYGFFPCNLLDYFVAI